MIYPAKYQTIVQFIESLYYYTLIFLKNIVYCNQEDIKILILIVYLNNAYFDSIHCYCDIKFFKIIN